MSVPPAKEEATSPTMRPWPNGPDYRFGSSPARPTTSNLHGQETSPWPTNGYRATLALPDVRTGNGYDVHAFEPGDRVTLCGVTIAHERR